MFSQLAGRLLLVLFANGSWVGITAQNAGSGSRLPPDPEPLTEHQPPEPQPRFLFSPNPPDCARDITDVVMHAAEMANQIIQATTTCAEDMGWRGWDATIGARKDGPFHDAETCAQQVSYIMSRFAWIMEDSFSASFSCSHATIGCEEACSDVFRSLFQAMDFLLRAVRNCPSANGRVQDYPTAGFWCWRWVWRMVQRLVRASKTLDLAVDMCRFSRPYPPYNRPPVWVRPPRIWLSPGKGGGSKPKKAPAIEPVPPEPVPIALAASASKATAEATSPTAVGWTAVEPDEPFAVWDNGLRGSAAAERRRLSVAISAAKGVG